jgi:phosphatidylserine/phosphatidylglycerophosphate/cardiolipin synthase-like enzyme
MADYLVDSAPTYTGCDVTPLVDGAEYTAALREALDKVGRDDHPGQFVLLAGWWLGLARGGFELVNSREVRMVDAPPFCLDPWPDGRVPFQDPADESTALLDLLAEKRQAGVEVWALGWVSPLALRMSRLAKLLGGAHAVAINALTMRSIEALRAAGAHAMPSTIGHLAGSTHCKIALVCDGRNTVGFSGGLDLELSRWSRTDHSGRQIWHDVVARVEGPAVQSICDHFRTLWEANRVDDTPALPARVVPTESARGNQHVQALRTLPAARYRRVVPVRKPLPLPGATEGSFTYRDALKKAIGAAQRCVYIEDPLLWSTEVMDWLNEALRREPGLRVVIVTGGLDDPNDPPLPHPQYLCQSINHHLLPGIDTGRVLFLRRAGVVVHAKTVVVDDAWACIGSCNIARRSLYTDIEHGFGFVDPSGDLVVRYRARLWAHHLGGDAAELTDLGTALDALGKRPERLVPMPLPVPEAPMGRRARNRYDTADDPDSRQRWAPRLF